MKRLPVKSIKVGGLHRKDMGDIQALADSIADVGLLHPVVVRPDNTLVAGARRLKAVKALGWDAVPVNVVTGLDEALALLKAERDENTCRKDYTPLERVALGKSLEALEKPKAKERQGRPGRERSGKLPEHTEGRTRDKVASALGVSGKTYEKEKAVVEAAEREPEKYADLALQMEQTGKADPAYKELKRRQTPPPQPEKHPHSERLAKWLRWVSGETCVIDIELGGIDALLQERDKWDWRDVREFILPMLEALSKTIRRYHQEIERHATQK